MWIRRNIIGLELMVQDEDSSRALANEYRDDEAVGNRPLNDRVHHAWKGRDSTCDIVCSLGYKLIDLFLLSFFFCLFRYRHSWMYDTICRSIPWQTRYTCSSHAEMASGLQIITKTFLSAMCTPCNTARRTLLVSRTICARRTDIPLHPFLIQFWPVAPRYTHRTMDLSPVLYRRYNMCGVL